MKRYTWFRGRFTFGVGIIKPSFFWFFIQPSETVCLFNDNAENDDENDVPLGSSRHPGLSSRFMPQNSWFVPWWCWEWCWRQVYHLPSRFMPETVGLFHTPAPLTTSYHKLQFLEILSFDRRRGFDRHRRRSHRVRGNNLTCNFPRAFEALFWNSSVVMIDHQSHIDHYDHRDPRCNSWKSRLLKDLVIQVDLHS